ncbi:hypothetical protein SRB5_39250 [Streptomyces sp. RB5]|uniref:Uncharacterized protein n=1 Tax=Streptomyces smaragdinus TaxID=2585196 RepID=A0A7K0CL90_9ACTN|nr:hypothetical protein [Streptomyces smaragdinus]MQY13772.1 hypothetical protein [Streptomyces smaragdinus]
MSNPNRKPRLSPAAVALVDQAAATSRDMGQPAFRIDPLPTGSRPCAWCDCPDDDAILGRHDKDTCPKCWAKATIAVVLVGGNWPALTLYTLCDRHRRPWWELHAAVLALPVNNPPPGLIL